MKRIDSEIYNVQPKLRGYAWNEMSYWYIHFRELLPDVIGRIDHITVNLNNKPK